MLARKETYRLDPDRIIDGELYDGRYFDIILIQRTDPETGEVRYYIDEDDWVYIVNLVVTTNAVTDELISCQVVGERLDADEARRAGFSSARGGGGAVWLAPDGSIHSTFTDGWDAKIARRICNYVD
ncbi:hypothetical protein [Gordonia jacobaea]|uniref:hypothetical protein n=1 Tax=Gordonia jacobaea TaxID=122202 RepID=UPI0022E5A148|nr:hypothetical protein [Gordonia jacobaea]